MIIYVIEKMKKDLEDPDYRMWIKKQTSSTYRIDESKRPVNIPSESFRKLESF